MFKDRDAGFSDNKNVIPWLLHNQKHTKSIKTEDAILCFIGIKTDVLQLEIPAYNLLYCHGVGTIKHKDNNKTGDFTSP